LKSVFILKGLRILVGLNLLLNLFCFIFDEILTLSDIVITVSGL